MLKVKGWEKYINKMPNVIVKSLFIKKELDPFLLESITLLTEPVSGFFNVSA